MTEKTVAERLAFTLRYLIDKGYVPGLLPKDVEKAATLLVEQETELDTLRAAVAANHHMVRAEVTAKSYRSTVRADFIIADPRLYYAEIDVDDRWAAKDPEWTKHVARQLVRVGTADWVRELEEQAFAAITIAEKQAA